MSAASAHMRPKPREAPVMNHVFFISPPIQWRRVDFCWQAVLDPTVLLEMLLVRSWSTNPESLLRHGWIGRITDHCNSPAIGRFHQLPGLAAGIVGFSVGLKTKSK